MQNSYGLIDTERRIPILVSEFSKIVKKKHFNANIEFEEEFEVSQYY